MQVTPQSQLSRPMSLGYLKPGVPSTEHPNACVHTNELQITNENREKAGDKENREPDTRPAVLELENNTHDDTGDADEDDACADGAEHDDGRADDAIMRMHVLLIMMTG